MRLINHVTGVKNTECVQKSTSRITVYNCWVTKSSLSVAQVGLNSRLFSERQPSKFCVEGCERSFTEHTAFGYQCALSLSGLHWYVPPKSKLSGLQRVVPVLNGSFLTNYAVHGLPMHVLVSCFIRFFLALRSKSFNEVLHFDVKRLSKFCGLESAKILPEGSDFESYVLSCSICITMLTMYSNKNLPLAKPEVEERCVPALYGIGFHKGVSA